MKSVLIISTILSLAFCQSPINAGYMYYTTNFTNNGGRDNSTCDLTINGLYKLAPQGATATVYNAFAWIQTDPSALSTGVAVGDRGFGCQVSFVAGSVGMTCSEITIITGPAIAIGSTITVTGVFGDVNYFGGTLHFTLTQFPEIWNRTLAATKGDKIWITASTPSAPSAITSFDGAVTTPTPTTGDAQFAYPNTARLSAPVCAQGFYNV